MVNFAFSVHEVCFNVRPRLLYVIFRFCKFTVLVRFASNLVRFEDVHKCYLINAA